MCNASEAMEKPIHCNHQKCLADSVSRRLEIFFSFFCHFFFCSAVGRKTHANVNELNRYQQRLNSPDRNKQPIDYPHFCCYWNRIGLLFFFFILLLFIVVVVVLHHKHLTSLLIYFDFIPSRCSSNNRFNSQLNINFDCNYFFFLYYSGS